MTNDPQELVLELLRAIRSDMTIMKSKLSDHDKRFSQIERQLAGIRGDMAVFQEMHVDHGDSIRHIFDRLERLERHVGLSETLSQ